VGNVEELGELRGLTAEENTAVVPVLNSGESNQVLVLQAQRVEDKNVALPSAG